MKRTCASARSLRYRSVAGAPPQAKTRGGTASAARFGIKGAEPTGAAVAGAPVGGSAAAPGVGAAAAVGAAGAAAATELGGAEPCTTAGPAAPEAAQTATPGPAATAALDTAGPAGPVATVGRGSQNARGAGIAIGTLGGTDATGEDSRHLKAPVAAVRKTCAAGPGGAEGPPAGVKADGTGGVPATSLPAGGASGGAASTAGTSVGAWLWFSADAAGSNAHNGTVPADAAGTATGGVALADMTAE